MGDLNLNKPNSLLPGCLARIKGSFTGLRPSEQKVAEVILKNPSQVIHLTVGEMAKLCEVSEATIIRFCQNIGYSGFQSLKMSLVQDVSVPSQFIPQGISPNDNLNDIIKKVTYASIQAIKDTTKVIDQSELEKALTAICNARKIDFYGVGYSGLIAQDASIRLNRLGLNTISYVDPHLQANSAILLGKEDVAFGISLLGRTEDILYSLQQAKRSGATVVSLTQYAKNPISSFADIKLYTLTEEKLFRTGSSRIAQLHVIDVLYAGVAVRRYDRSLECLQKTKHIGFDKRI